MTCIYRYIPHIQILHVYKFNTIKINIYYRIQTHINTYIYYKLFNSIVVETFCFSMPRRGAAALATRHGERFQPESVAHLPRWQCVKTNSTPVVHIK